MTSRPGRAGRFETRCDSTLASLHISRCVTSIFDISSVNRATGISSDAEVGGDAERERGLPHRRPCREDDEVAGLETGGQLVELLEAGRHAGDVGARLVQVRDPLEALLEQLLDVREVAGDALLRELEDPLLGTVDEIGDLAGPLPAEPCDVLPGGDQAAQRRHLLDDLRVVADVRRGGHERDELVDPLAAAGRSSSSRCSSRSTSVIASTGSPFCRSSRAATKIVPWLGR